MTLPDSLVTVFVTAIKLTQAAPAPTVLHAYMQVKSLLASRYAAIDLPGLERRPDSAAKQQSVAEDLADLAVTRDPDCLALVLILSQALLAAAPTAVSTIGIDGEQIAAAALLIRNVHSNGTAVRLRDSTITEQIEITEVAAGVPAESPLNARTPSIEFTHVTAGGNITINTADPSFTHIATLRMNYLQRLFQRADTIFLSHMNPSSQVAARISLKAVYTAQLTQSFVTSTGATASARPPTVSAQEQRLTALESINLHQHLVLLGAPGSGKSSFLKFVALCMAGEFLHHSEANLALLAVVLPVAGPTVLQSGPGWRHGPLLPVYITLRDLIAEGVFVEQTQGGAEHLIDYITRELARADLAEYGPYLQRELWESGGFLLLDGLDEVPDQADLRLQLRQAIEEFSASFPKCRVVISSRPYAYQEERWRLPHFAETHLAPFDLWQMERFIDYYFLHLLGAHTPLAVQEAQTQANVLKAAIRNGQYLRELATSPLLLTLMVSLFVWRGGVLLDKSEELYAQGVDLLLNEWERPKREPTDEGAAQPLALSVHEWLQAPQQKIRQALEELAYRAHAQQATLDAAARIAESDVVDALLQAAGRDARPGRLADYIQNRAGLLIDHGNGWHSFPHRTIQEYLAACYLTRTNFPKQLATLVRAEPQRWREVLLLAGEKAVRGAPYAAWALIDRLCPLPYHSTTAATESDWWMALLAGRLLVRTTLYRADLLDVSERQTIDTVKGWLLALLDTTALPAADRVIAGADLGVMGDPRRGVGLAQAGLPEIDWIEIAAGPFLMGATNFSCTLLTAPYRISRYPITVAQYQRFVQAGGYNDSRHWTAAGWAWRQQLERQGPATYAAPHLSPTLPITGVSWYEAIAFCHWLSAETGETVNLPSEAQWERAARHTDGRTYPWGDDFAATRCNMRDSGLAQPSPVGLFPTGHAACGAADLAGNVWEWCATPWRSTYEADAHAVDNAQTGVERRVLRGGSWANEQHLVRCAHRHRNYPDHWGPNVGFRVVALHP